MIPRKREVELQRRITLDEALLEGMETFRNGCNFRLLRMVDGTHWLEYGCYGVHVNLAQGAERLLLGFVGRGDGYSPKALDGLVHPQTLVELLKRPPCGYCGAPLYQMHQALEASS